MIADGVLAELAAHVGSIDTAGIASVGGGSINAAFALRTAAGERYFLKTNRARGARDMFAAERDGLAELAAAASVRVPAPVACGETEGTAWLLLEYLALGRGGDAAAAELGRRLAQQHRHTGAVFGWTRDNTIGSTPQLNAAHDDWIEFFADKRLGFQLRLAADNGYSGALQRDGESLRHRLPEFFTHYSPPASLLHGDLWGGNWGVAGGGEPVCFDPAVYYGDRETDLAMTMLFGGFGPAFYAAYNEAWPLDDGFDRRRDLYNLYHVLNHLNLFGSGYLGQAESLLQGLLGKQQ